MRNQFEKISTSLEDVFVLKWFVLSEEAVVVYHQTNQFNAAADKGINFNSFGFDWPISQPIVSKKDLALPGLNENYK